MLSGWKWNAVQFECFLTVVQFGECKPKLRSFHQAQMRIQRESMSWTQVQLNERLFIAQKSSEKMNRLSL